MSLDEELWGCGSSVHFIQQPILFHVIYTQLVVGTLRVLLHRARTTSAPWQRLVV